MGAAERPILWLTATQTSGDVVAVFGDACDRGAGALHLHSRYSVVGSSDRGVGYRFPASSRRLVVLTSVCTKTRRSPNDCTCQISDDFHVKPSPLQDSLTSIALRSGPRGRLDNILQPLSNISTAEAVTLIIGPLSDFSFQSSRRQAVFSTSALIQIPRNLESVGPA